MRVALVEVRASGEEKTCFATAEEGPASISVECAVSFFWSHLNNESTAYDADEAAWDIYSVEFIG